jgi:UDP-N-acetylbacillosamine N-acetyltransferase
MPFNANIEPVVIWGASGHAKVVADIIRTTGNYKIIGFLDDINTERHNLEFCGSTIIGGREKTDELIQNGVDKIIIAIGDCKIRNKLATFAKSKGFKLIRAIHPSAIIAQGTIIGLGTVVSAGAVVNPGSIIGENVIINTHASLDHECVIGDSAHIGPGVKLGGATSVAQETWIGIGATVIDHISIGHSSIIGAGAVVVTNIPSGVVAYGIPAKAIRKVTINDK